MLLIILQAELIDLGLHCLTILYIPFDLRYSKTYILIIKLCLKTTANFRDARYLYCFKFDPSIRSLLWPFKIISLTCISSITGFVFLL